MSRLGRDEIAAELATTPGWGRRGKAIERSYRFPDFKAAMLFVSAVTALAEGAGHHPDIAVHYDTVTLSLWTHAAGGLTAKDFALARQIDAVPEPLPAVFRARFAGLEEQLHPSGVEDLFHRCFGCGPAHPLGLRVRCFRTAAGVTSPVFVDSRWEGPPGAAHGGIVAAYLDEILAGAVVRATGRVAVTGELTVRYVRPVPLETPLVGGARLVVAHDRYADVEGSLERLDTAEVLATGRGRFVFVTEPERPV